MFLDALFCIGLTGGNRNTVLYVYSVTKNQSLKIQLPLLTLISLYRICGFYCFVAPAIGQPYTMVLPSRNVQFKCWSPTSNTRPTRLVCQYHYPCPCSTHRAYMQHEFWQIRWGGYTYRSQHFLWSW